MEIKSGIYKHFKGKESFVIGVASHSDNESLFVIYQGLQDNKLHARPYESFKEYVDYEGKQVPRFSLVKEIEIDFIQEMNKKCEK